MCALLQKYLCLFACLILIATIHVNGSNDKPPKRTFEIDFENDRFLKDGVPFHYVSGDLHYYRVPSIYWRDRMLKMKAAGLNAIQDLGFVVLLRAPPYIDSEWDNGGLPWWLIKGPQNKDIYMRTNDTRYITPMKRWYDRLFPILVPLLYKNGGPIIMAAVENEYGSYKGCDVKYTAYLRDLMRSYVGYDTVLYSVDGGSLGYLKCGHIPAVYTTVDGGNVKTGFDAQRVYAPRGPHVNSEYYPGWLDLWGTNHSVVSAETVLNGIDEMFRYNASFNMLMFAGGTNFGFWAGSEAYNPVDV